MIPYLLFTLGTISVRNRPIVPVTRSFGRVGAANERVTV